MTLNKAFSFSLFITDVLFYRDTLKLRATLAKTRYCCSYCYNCYLRATMAKHDYVYCVYFCNIYYHYCFYHKRFDNQGRRVFNIICTGIKIRFKGILKDNPMEMSVSKAHLGQLEWLPCCARGPG